jgi:iron complex outermembrane receptor protein
MQNYRFLSSRLMAGAAMAGLLAGVSVPALAATAVATADQAAPAPGEVVVTARKRSEKLIDAPLAITALSATSLEQHDWPAPKG